MVVSIFKFGLGLVNKTAGQYFNLDLDLLQKKAD